MRAATGERAQNVAPRGRVAVQTRTLAARTYPAGYPTDLTSVYWSNPTTPFWRPTPLYL